MGSQSGRGLPGGTVTLFGECEPRLVVLFGKAPGLPALATLGGWKDPSV
jgi:hypothetical protein